MAKHNDINVIDRAANNKKTENLLQSFIKEYLPFVIPNFILKSFQINLLSTIFNYLSVAEDENHLSITTPPPELI